LHRRPERGTERRSAVPLLDRYVRFLVRRAWAVLITIMLVTAWLAAGLPRLRTDFDVEASLPADHPFVRIDREIRATFGGRNTVIVAIVPRTGDAWRPEVLEVVRDVTLAALRLPDVIAQNVVSLAAPSVRHVEDRGGSLSVEYLMREVPRTPEEIARLRAWVEDDPQLNGLLVTPDDQAAIVLLDFWPGPPAHELAARALSLAAPYRDRPLDFYFAGEPIVALTDVEQSAEVARRIPVTFAVIALMLLFSFRNLQGMLIPMLTAALSTVWGLGIMARTGIAIDSWNVAVPILLIAVAAAHSAQMLKRYTEEVVRLGDNRAAVIESTVRMGPVMLAAGSVAALGFASLALFGVPAIAHFGLACAYGIASAVLLEMTLIPALRSLLPAPRHVPRAGGLTERLLARIHRGIVRHDGRAVLVGTAVALALAALGATRIRTFGSTREYLAPGSLPRTHLEAIEKHFPGTVTMTILYEGEPGSAKTVGVLRHMEALQQELAADPLVWRTASLADLVKTLHRAFDPDGPAPYSIPDDQALVSQLVFLGDSPAFERFTDRAQGKALVIAYLRDDDSARVGPLIRRVQRWLAAYPPPPGERVLVAGGTGPIVLAVNEHTTYGKLLNMLVVLATIWAISSVMLRSPLGGLYVATPILVTVALLFGLLGWTGIRLDMGSASVIAIAAGVGADYAIYFLYRLREERARTADDVAAVGAALQTSGRAVIFVAASIGAGFAVIGFTRFFGLRLFGTLMPAAMVISCLAALAVIPVLVLRTRPRFVFGGEARPVQARASASRGLAVLFVLALAPAAARADDALAPGRVLDRDTAAAAEGLLPPETLAHYRAGEYRNAIAAWPAGPAWDEAFEAASRRNAGRLSVDARGTIVERASGKPAHGLYGLPFRIDPADPQAGVEVIWNAYYALWRTASSHDVVALDWVGRHGLERQAEIESRTLYWEGVPPQRAPKQNGLGLASQQLALVLSPADLNGTASLVWRFQDAEKRDSAWTYVPALRRVRQISPANRSDGFLGSDLSQDDGTFFDGKPEDFTWRLVGEREALVLADPASLVDRVQRRGRADGGIEETWPADQKVVGYEDPGWKGAPWAPIAPVLVRRRLWVVEARPRDPYYLFARLEIGIDQETFQGASSRKFDAQGVLLRSLAFLLHAPRPIDAGGERLVLGGSSMEYIGAENPKAARATVVAPPPGGGSVHERRVPMDPGLFALERLGAAGK
jgi:hypothetical protein